MLTAVVYIDEVFLVNAAVDLLLLKTAAALTGGGERPWRLWTGAAFGGLAAAAVYLPGLGWLGRLPGSALSYAGLCLLCFGWRSRAWKRWLWFFCVCCGFAGLALALCGLLRLPAFSRDGRVYYRLSGGLLVLLAGLTYGLWDNIHYELQKAVTQPPDDQCTSAYHPARSAPAPGGSAGPW